MAKPAYPIAANLGTIYIIVTPSQLTSLGDASRPPSKRLRLVV